jgi:hypothetical protein
MQNYFRGDAVTRQRVFPPDSELFQGKWLRQQTEGVIYEGQKFYNIDNNEQLTDFYS